MPKGPHLNSPMQSRSGMQMTSPDKTAYHWSHQLHQAASENSTDSLHQLLKQGHSPNLHGGVQCWLRGASSSQSRTPLHYAAKGGHLDSIRLLLVYGADPNARDEDGYTPLHYVCQIYSPGVGRCDGVRKCVESLIEFGADVRAETNSRCTPRDLARRQNNTVCLEAVNNYCETVPTLLHLTRHRVVGLIHAHWLPRVQHLWIPHSLKRYLWFEDVIAKWRQQ